MNVPHGSVPILSLILLGSYQAQVGRDTSKYERFLAEAYAREQFNGVALVFDHGAVMYQGAFGLRSTDPEDSLDLNSQFRLASVSKQFTAMCIMVLKEQGRLRYDQDVRDFVPELPYEGITIRHLLHHTSGLPDHVRMMDATWRTDLRYDDPARYVSGNEEVVKLLAKLRVPLAFRPGEEWQYSNTGYDLLGTIVARASGMSLPDFADRFVFGPAGMDHTLFYEFVPGHDPNMPDRTYGFQLGWDRRTMEPADGHYLNKTMGEDGVYSTVGDLLKWDRALYTEKLVSNATLKEAFTPAVLNSGETTDYGFGWFIEGAGTVVKHSGGWLSFSTYIQRDLANDKCLIVLSNNSSTHFSGIVQGLTDLLYDRPARFPPLSIREVMGRVVAAHGVSEAIAFYHTEKARRPAAYRFDEIELNMLGYELMWHGRSDDAAEIQKLNVAEFPNSANAYDSYGDALLAKGDTTAALSNFKRCFALDPSFTATKEKVDALLKRRLPADK